MPPKRDNVDHQAESLLEGMQADIPPRDVHQALNFLDVFLCDQTPF